MLHYIRFLKQILQTLKMENQTLKPFIDDNLPWGSATPYNTSESTQSGLWLSYNDVSKIINVYVTPVITGLGILGNLVSFIVFVATPLKHQSSSVHLASLALADTGFLFTVAIIWFSWVKIHVVHNMGWCQILVYIGYVCGFVSVWAVVGFTCERYVAVCHPFHRLTFCTVKRARLYVCSSWVFAFLLYSASLWINGIETMYGRSVCVHRAKYTRLRTGIVNVDVIITMIVPLFIIIVINGIICIQVWRIVRQHVWLTQGSRRETSSDIVETTSLSAVNRSPVLGNAASRRSTKGQCQPLSNRVTANNHRHLSQNMLQLKTTRMLLVVSSVFILLNGPSHAIRIKAFFTSLSNEDTPLPSETILRAQECAQLLYYSNFAINFLLYSACARTFRQALRKLVSRLINKFQHACQKCTCSSSVRETRSQQFEMI